MCSCLKDLTSSVKEAEATNVPWWDGITDIMPDTAIPLNHSTNLHTSNLWRYSPNCSRCVHRNVGICVLTEINNNFVTNF